ncbi:MAG: isoprenylcysteine carboxylmethyltransferase family protein [Castellaniella sp.]|uniref:methyltransferase family protein n=1 Tax=Castellaniella sp. TaxID=1955812 RepID=UPI002A36A927|nr:isoprenylcysteine carboxylmethyltransferase family protein [Castellaniella sp.]MDY0308694.1 isoprenylcysteine carboxylmethyltransferase family protein [Castellaniella sp.]
MSLTASTSSATTAACSQVEIDSLWERLAHAQVLRRRALGILGGLAVLVLPWVGSAWPQAGWINQGLEWLGLALMALALLGRCACMLYLGGRKGADLVADGPYSVCRNPLYVFSVLAVLGIGLQTGSLAVGLILALVAWGVFRWIVSEEERMLRASFGAPFKDYCTRVPRFLPRLAGWRSPQHVTVDLQGVWNTARDALPYFLSIPLFEAIEAAQNAGWIHVRLWLY